MKHISLKNKGFLLVSTALVSLFAIAKPVDANQTQTTTTTWTYSLPTASPSSSSSTSVSGTCPASSPSGGDGGGDDPSGGVDNDGDGLGDAPSGDGTPTADCCSPEGAGADGGDGGGSVLCTYFFGKGMLAEHIYLADLAYGKAHVSENVLNGYHAWAVPMVRYLRAHPDSLAEKVAYYLVRGWTQEMAYTMGASDKGSLVGKILRTIGEPICAIIGKIAGVQNWQSLYTKENLAS